MGAGASAGVSEAIHAATKAELKSVLPKRGEDREKLSSALEELSLVGAGGQGVDDQGRVFWNPEGRARVIFEECDTDRNGLMDLEELRTALRRDDDMAQEYGLASFGHIQNMDHVVALFKEADVDHSGFLCWDEFRSLMHRLRCGELQEILSRRALSTPPSSPAQQGQTASWRCRRGSGVGLGAVEDSRRCSFDEDSRRGSFDASLSINSDLRPADINDWHIDYWNLDAQDQYLLFLQALREWGCLPEIPVAPKTLRNFVFGVRRRYNDCPYHNFHHAVATVHYSYKLVEAAGLRQTASTLDRFSLLSASLCHDCGHEGRNTAFEVLTLSPIALRYNDRSPLENHHCATAFEVALSGDGETYCNIFKNLDDACFRHIRQRMVAGILGTDMALHNDHVKKLKNMQSAEEAAKKDDGEFLVEIFLHSADIGNPYMPPDISYRWGLQIAEEFTAQVEEEQRLGIPVTSMMVGLMDPKKNAKSRVGFIEFVVMPLAAPLFLLFPGLVVPKKHLEENREAEKQRCA